MKDVVVFEATTCIRSMGGSCRSGVDCEQEPDNTLDKCFVAVRTKEPFLILVPLKLTSVFTVPSTGPACVLPTVPACTFVENISLFLLFIVKYF